MGGSAPGLVGQLKPGADRLAPGPTGPAVACLQYTVFIATMIPLPLSLLSLSTAMITITTALLVLLQLVLLFEAHIPEIFRAPKFPVQGHESSGDLEWSKISK